MNEVAEHRATLHPFGCEDEDPGRLGKGPEREKKKGSHGGHGVGKTLVALFYHG